MFNTYVLVYFRSWAWCDGLFFFFFEESWIPGIGIKSIEIRGVNFPLSLSLPDWRTLNELGRLGRWDHRGSENSATVSNVFLVCLSETVTWITMVWELKSWHEQLNSVFIFLAISSCHLWFSSNYKTIKWSIWQRNWTRCKFFVLPPPPFPFNGRKKNVI